MRLPRRAESIAKSDNTRLELTSMIDVVFLLLVFFVMTFKVIATEGDLAIDTQKPGTTPVDNVPPGEMTFHVRVTADDSLIGGIWFDQRQVATFDELHGLIQQLVADHMNAGGKRGDLSVVLHLDDALDYRHTIAALSAIRGHRDGEEVQPLIDKVRLARISRPGG